MSSEADLLKVAPNAGLDEIKKAYRKAALAHHPDQNPDPGAARHFRRLTEAYRFLSEQALRREPARPKVRPPAQRLEFLLSDLRSLLKRWPAERWGRVVDGLPAVVWAASLLDVLAQSWPGAPRSRQASIENLQAALEDWEKTGRDYAPAPREAKRLNAALGDAEARLKALSRPSRS